MVGQSTKRLQEKLIRNPELIRAFEHNVPVNLDLGCGDNKQPGFFGVDMRDLEGVDITWDLEEFPWPIPDEAARVIMLSHFIEHVRPRKQIDFMDEAWRVLKPDGMLLISTPYGGSYRYNQDPTHCAPWNEATVAYFVKGTGLYDVYKPKPWKLERCNYFVQGDLEAVLRKDDPTRKE